jgi:hypothetical protein
MRYPGSAHCHLIGFRQIAGFADQKAGEECFCRPTTIKPPQNPRSE